MKYGGHSPPYVVENAALSDFDLADFDPRENLPMTGAAADILPTAELLDHQFRAFRCAEHFSRNADRRQRGLPDLQAFVGTQGKHPVELDLGARRGIAEIDIQGLALFHFQLTAAIENNCVKHSLA
jgi:hypothetical protein